MNSHQRKIIRDHASKNGHLVSIWDRADFSWYAAKKMTKDGRYVETLGNRKIK